MLSRDQEKALIRDCISGDKLSWDRFVSQYSKMVFSFIHGSLRGYGRANTPDLVDDLFQEVFLALMKDDFKKLSSFGWKNNASFSTWIKVVVGRLVSDHLKRYSNQQNKHEPLDETREADDDGRQVRLNKLDTEDRIDAMREQAKKLPASDRLLFRLLSEGMSAEDIAKYMMKSVEAIYMQKTRVLNKLRQELQKMNVSF